MSISWEDNSEACTWKICFTQGAMHIKSKDVGLLYFMKSMSFLTGGGKTYCMEIAFLSSRWKCSY